MAGTRFDVFYIKSYSGMANNREDMVAMVQVVGPQLLWVLDNNNSMARLTKQVVMEVKIATSFQDD